MSLLIVFVAVGERFEWKGLVPQGAWVLTNPCQVESENGIEVKDSQTSLVQLSFLLFLLISLNRFVNI